MSPAKAEVFLRLKSASSPWPTASCKQNAGPAGAEDDGHLACGSFDGSELQDGGAGGFACVVFRRFVAFEEVHGDATAAAAGAASGVRAVLRDDEDVEAGERLGVAGEGAVGCGDEDAAELVVEAGADLGDAGVVGAGGFVGALDEGEFGGDLGVAGGAGDGVERGCFGVAEAAHQLFGGAAGDEGCCSGCAEQTVAGEVVGVGVAGALAGDDADAAAYADALAGGLDEGLIDAERGGGNRFKIKVRVLASR